jgi:hypothetical protein
VCIFCGISSPPRALSQGSSLNFPCSHVPMEIFLFYEMGKKTWKTKESCLQNKGRFPILVCVLLSFGNTLGAHTHPPFCGWPWLGRRTHS